MGFVQAGCRSCSRLPAGGLWQGVEDVCPAGTPCPAWHMQHCHRERAAWPSVGFGELLLPHEWARHGSGKPEQLFEMTPENTGLPLPQLEAESPVLSLGEGDRNLSRQSLAWCQTRRCLQLSARALPSPRWLAKCPGLFVSGTDRKDPEGWGQPRVN